MLRKTLGRALQSHSFLANKNIRSLTTNASNNLNRMLSEDFQYEPPIKITHPKITFSHFAGYPEIVKKMRALQNFITKTEACKKMGARPPAGIILEGQPGTGKSLLAKAFAGEMNYKFIGIGASDLLHPHVNGTERVIANFFRIARLNSPCVICIDEIDSIATRRIQNIKDSSDVFSNSIVNKMLTELEQLNPNIIIFATTNDIDLLDPAITRPGRFDRKIHIPMPAFQDRAEILKIMLANKPIAADVNVNKLAQISERYSGAKLAAWVNEAAILAVSDGVNSIALKHFEIARLDLNHGYEKIEKMSKKLRWSLALHEAGHALVGHLLKLNQFHQISMRRRGTALGFTERKFSKQPYLPTKQKCLDLICAKLGGRASEIAFGEVSEGAFDDLEQAKSIARHMVINEGMGGTISGLNAAIDVENILQEQMQRAIKLLKQNEKSMMALVNVLMKKDLIEEKEFKEILQSVKNNAKFFQPTSAQAKAKKSNDVVPVIQFKPSRS